MIIVMKRSGETQNCDLLARVVIAHSSTMLRLYEYHCEKPRDKPKNNRGLAVEKRKNHMHSIISLRL
jgi:hypothetical protein